MTFEEFLSKINIKKLPANAYQVSIFIDGQLYQIETFSIDEKYLKSHYENLLKALSK